MRRFAQLFSAVALIGLLLAVVGAEPASAFKTKTLTVQSGQTTEEKLGPIVGNYPAGTAAIPEPPDCGDDDDTAPFEATCDLVPLKIVVPPDLGPTDDFLLTLTVTWDPTDDVDGQGVNDLDVYLFDNTQIAKRTAPKSTRYTELAVSAGGSQPEVIKLFSPDLVDYNLVVINFAGPNVSYTVKGEIKVEGFQSPFEDLGPTFAPRTRNTTAARDDRNESFVAPIDRSGDDPPSSSGGSSFSGRPSDSPDLTDVGSILSGGRTLDEVPILPDTDFARLDPAASDGAFAAPALPEGAGRTRAVAAAGPVSGLLVAFWLVLVPLALVAAGVFFLIRRSRNAFSFA